MPRKRPKTRHAEIVRLFAESLKAARRSRGLTQAQLAREAHVTVSYIARLEGAGSAPGIDLLARLATALGVTVHDLLPSAPSPDTLAVLRDRARHLFDELLRSADRETLLMVCPLLARLLESPRR